MSVHPPGSRNTAQWMADRENWFDSAKEEAIFQSRDKQLNILHKGSHLDNRAMWGRGITFDEQLSENSPFTENADINHQIRVSDNVDSGNIDNLLEDENSDLDLEWSEDGQIYQVNMFENLDIPDYRDLNGENIHKTDLDTDLLGLHAIIYEDGDGEDYLVHWDPAKYDGITGEKMKFLDNKGQPDLGNPLNTEENDNYFESYTNQEREEGLDQVYDTLVEESNNLYHEATEEMVNSSRQGEVDIECSDHTYRKAWEGERWRAMADTVKNFNTSMNNGHTQNVEKSISF